MRKHDHGQISLNPPRSLKGNNKISNKKLQKLNEAINLSAFTSDISNNNNILNANGSLGGLKDKKAKFNETSQSITEDNNLDVSISNDGSSSIATNDANFDLNNTKSSGTSTSVCNLNRGLIHNLENMARSVEDEDEMDDYDEDDEEEDDEEDEEDEDEEDDAEEEEDCDVSSQEKDNLKADSNSGVTNDQIKKSSTKDLDISINEDNTINN